MDLPGEAGTIMHKQENMGQVELATMSFGQSFQVTPIQMAATVSSLVNGGTRVTPHFGSPGPGRRGRGTEGIPVSGEGAHCFQRRRPIPCRALLEGVVSEGSGKNAYLEGYHDRREDRHLPDPPKKRQPVYLFFYRISRRRTTRRSWGCA